ncbi:MAG: ABC transporter substrate-binding protein [Burkholderiaceae bacterium]
MPLPSAGPTRRRSSFATLAASLLLVALLAPPPAAADPRLLLFLSNGPSASERGCVDELRATLEKLGWSFDEQLKLEPHHADSDETRLAGLAETLVARQPALLIATEVAPLAALLKATREIPIVAIGASNLLSSGAVDEAGRPLANATGVTLSLSGQHTAKPLEVLRQAFPAARRIGIIENHGNPLHKRPAASMAAVAERAGVTLIRAHFAGTAGIAAAWDELKQQDVDVVAVRPDSPAHLPEHARQSLRVKLPAVSHHSLFTRSGGLLAYGVVGRTAMCPRGAHYADQLLRGRPIGELPVEELFEAGLAINLATAAKLGAELPKTVMSRADHLIR